MRASKRIAQMKEKAQSASLALEEKSAKTNWCCDPCRQLFSAALESTQVFLKAANSAYELDPLGSFDKILVAYETAMSMYKLADAHLNDVDKASLQAQKDADSHFKLPESPNKKKEYLN